jgi:hypothetical protein
MISTRSLVTALLFAMVPVLGCAKEPSQASVQPTASTPPETKGLAERQAPSPRLPASPDETPPCAEAPFSAMAPPPATGEGGSLAIEAPAPGAVIAVKPDGTPVTADAISPLSAAQPKCAPQSR